jgi:uncharacterized protein YraI
MKTLISAAVITLALTRAPAHATASGCAVVLRTPDGFLNVRTGPSMKAPIVGKFRPGDLIGIDSTECGRVKGREVCNSKEWTFTDGKIHRVPGPPIGPSGWVYTKHIGGVDCDELQSSER